MQELKNFQKNLSNTESEFELIKIIEVINWNERVVSDCLPEIKRKRYVLREVRMELSQIKYLIFTLFEFNCFYIIENFMVPV